MRVRILGTLLPCLVACFVFPAALMALPWSLASCDAAGEPRWHAFEQEIRASKPGGTLYVPKPYPTADRQVIADFLYHFRVLHKGKDSDHLAALPLPSDGRVVEGIANERVSYQVTRVENWTQMRCGWQHKQDFYYLVQVFEVTTGEEITRAALDYSGLFVTSINMPASVPGPVEPSALRPLPSPTTAMDEVNREFGLQGVDPEYVATFGTVDCNITFSCLAFHEGGLSYLVFHHELFEVSSRGAKLISGKDVGTLATNKALFPTLTADERVISLGGPVWTIARKASAAQIRHGLSNFAR